MTAMNDEPAPVERRGYGATVSAIAAASQAGVLYAADELLGADALLEDVEPRRLALLGAAVAAGVAGANLRAAAVADLAVAAWCSASAHRPTPVLGVGRPYGDPERLQGAMRTVVEHALALGVEDPTERLGAQRAAVGRLAYAEPLAAGTEALHEAMVAQRRAGMDVAGWVRELDADPCAQCARWGDGAVRPLGVRMKRHPHDACYPRPVTTAEAAGRVLQSRREPVLHVRERAAAERQRKERS